MDIKEMTSEEILRQQLELLAEASLTAEPETLAVLSSAMIEIVRVSLSVS